MTRLVRFAGLTRIGPSPGEGFVRPHELLDDLLEDVHLAFEELEYNKESQYRRRIVVRAVFAHLEGLLAALKLELFREAHRQHREGTPAPPAEDIGFLKGCKATFANGEWQYGRHVRFGLSKNINSTFAIGARIWRVDFQPDPSGYQSLSFAREARNRLMHPKTYYDILISGDEMGHVAKTSIWFRNEIARLFELHVEAIIATFPEDERERLRTAFSKER